MSSPPVIQGTVFDDLGGVAATAERGKAQAAPADAAGAGRAGRSRWAVALGQLLPPDRGQAEDRALD